ncbi:BrnT family toxin [Acidithiobacillus ferridurans]|uniref:BrnT family toxin n=1 Tax=Acidithiobacillus ferridurans TaxID=1232575 RepID=UPI000DE37161|nr:BrnT family toxin [Acidithiobacillus ferridurans]RBL98500.1 BrnT family toxin [Acidithiobacillus ferridurans]
MKLDWDEEKRQTTLAHRERDFADCVEVFADVTFEFPDKRKDYGEACTVCIGFLKNRMIAVVYTQRGNTRRIISMRKCNDREIETYRERLAR